MPIKTILPLKKVLDTFPVKFWFKNGVFLPSLIKVFEFIYHECSGLNIQISASELTERLPLLISKMLEG